MVLAALLLLATTPLLTRTSGSFSSICTMASTMVAPALVVPSSTRAWLAHHGQWDVAAQELGVHRHTLRYRIRRVEELLGRSLDDADLRAELWFALELRAHQSG